MTDEWRPFRLVSYSEQHYKRPPGDKPPAAAELSADGAWATLYADDRRTIVASWMRHRLPTREALARAAEERRARESRRTPTETVS